MKKGKAPLALLLTIILLFMASSGASAAVIGSAAYWWDATETGTNINIASLTIAGDAAAGNSFSLYSWADPTNVLTLVSPVSSTTTITYPFGGSVTQTIYIGDNASGYILKHEDQYYAGIYNTSNYITLGATPRFGFSFSDGSNTYLDYTLANQGPGWNLTGPNGMTVNVQGGVTPSAVPIPGSLLLFGSGLLGLWGIGSRRNKAQLA